MAKTTSVSRKVVKDAGATRLIGFECGFGYFAGDIVVHPKKGRGRVVCIYRTSQAVAIAWNGEALSTFHPKEDRKLEKTGERIVAPMFPKHVLTWLYKQYDLSDRVMFWYHWKGTGKQAASDCAEKFALTLDEVRDILRVYKDLGFL